MNTKSNLMMLVIVPLAVIFMSPMSADANDSFGSWGGSWGSSSGLFGSQGGPVRNLLARAPVRTALARVADRLTGFGSSGGGSFGGSYGGGSFGGSFGGGSLGNRYAGWGRGGSTGNGSWGGSRGFASGSTGYGGSGGGFAGSSYGSWGSSSISSSSYVSSGYSSSVVAEPSFVSAPAYAPSVPFSLGTTYPSGIGAIASPAFADGNSFSGGFALPTETSFSDPNGFPSLDAGVTGGSVIEPYYSSPVEGGDALNQLESILGPVEGQGIETSPSGIQPNPFQGGGSFGDPPSEPIPGSDNSASRKKRLQKSTIEVRLPEEAKVYVNGKLTKSRGDLRSFVSRNQKAGSKYRYEIAAVLNGQRKVQEFTMRAGNTKAIEFDFSALTTVALKVPDDAKVVLAGNETSGQGKARKFETKRLALGEKWDGYTVKVTVVRDGKEIVRQRTLDVIGGKTYALNFDFDQVENTVVATK